MTDFAELDRLAREARQDFADYDMPWPICPEDVMDMNPSHAVSAYIAACSPEVVLRLVSIAKAAEAYMKWSDPVICSDPELRVIRAALREALSPEKERE